MEGIMKERVRLNRLDKAGIVCSGACAVHCMAAPLIAFFAPTITTYFENEWVHILLLVAILPIAGITFYRHKKIHGHVAPLSFGMLGIAILTGAVLCDQMLGIGLGKLEMAFSMVGSGLLIAGHLLNMRYLRG